MLLWAMHFASGDSLFSGTALIVASLAGGHIRSLQPWRKLRRVLLIVGVLFVFLSATPWPMWLYALWFVLLAVALAVGIIRQGGRAIARLPVLAEVAFLALSCLLCIQEVSTMTAHLPSNGDAPLSRLYVVGDSISAGMNPDDHIWPLAFAERQDVEVINLARAGGTVKSALQQIADLPADESGLVVVEIGGNDLLSGRSAAEFEAGLRQLLRSLRSAGWSVVLLELPLSPFSSGYGLAQRRLAAEFDAALMSKRALARVLSHTDSTVDGLHLSTLGHQRLAAEVAAYLRNVLPDSSTTTRTSQAR